ncbi:hypothetical protein vB_PsyM_KIL3b_0117 [Pseudomonas phage vB_PsyM_KIL3b]|uniref:Uncharacterized protein n=6 Tax=Flaumdravirus TaxID=2560133 RepID=A0A142IE67_9CAUD|nr:hypothetical protein BH774_gp086 [Pseudomonas phage vB_PsyM_KIL1]YP_009616796.1 hypothetical protein FDI83_gp094 [Pseudomonas phage vB_PsyM_KIL4]AMR57522.1 hypothetical protein vB_PsyM_KIL2_0122 [Pseudomonas phage vB_PsyM_KIL2]AMR57684.1 hypothetical protein vB_PsyM_KIL3_0117 [Pseudomonas phage vB_PsyM_KIL3]AMR58015.1 hypothetical protein vB_PsyM_KIL5_0124 [Pseudomonas phage vB_PsyM_KIL5]AMR58182.1 hypothetical protein vB_PsyM_KIL3b_0117 [Pseudomonas phage vB_PsyM_KIL3b]AMR57363.1 hypothet
MSIHRRVNEAYSFQLLNSFKENNTFPDTAQGMVDYLFQDESDYKVYHLKEVYNKSTLVNRLNLLWVYPIWLVASPFLWVFTGSAGVDNHSKLGKFLAKITNV